MAHLNRNQAVPAGRQGFTLVELLVSISIISTLTAILLPNFMGARERAKDSRKIQDMTSMKNALRAYYNDKQAYPTPAGTGVGLGVGFSGYFPGVTTLGYGYTYEQVDGGDGFNLKVALDSGQGTDDTDSQTRCGTGTAIDKLYVVCAK